MYGVCQRSPTLFLISPLRCDVSQALRSASQAHISDLSIWRVDFLFAPAIISALVFLLPHRYDSRDRRICDNMQSSIFLGPANPSNVLIPRLTESVLSPIGKDAISNNPDAFSVVSLSETDVRLNVSLFGEMSPRYSVPALCADRL